MHLAFQRLYHRLGKTSMYKLKHFDCSIYLCFIYVLRYKVTILEHHLITKSGLLVGRNQTSLFVKWIAWLLVLMREYWLNNEGPPLFSSEMVRAYWLDDKWIPLVYHWFRWQKSNTCKLSVLTKVLARWLGSWQVIWDNQTEQ